MLKLRSTSNQSEHVGGLSMSRNPKYIKMIQSQRWRNLRNRKIAKQPLCERCVEKQRTTLASEVHHIKPVETGTTYQQMHFLMFNFDNLMSVCKSCHVELHRTLNSYDKKNIQANNKRYTKRFIAKFLK